jgi:hypothetical protein
VRLCLAYLLLMMCSLDRICAVCQVLSVPQSQALAKQACGMGTILLAGCMLGKAGLFGENCNIIGIVFGFVVVFQTRFHALPANGPEWLRNRPISCCETVCVTLARYACISQSCY